MEFHNLTWRNRIAWVLLAAILMAGCGGFEEFAFACTGVPVEYLDDYTIMLLIVVYGFLGGEGGYTPGGEFLVEQDIPIQPGFVTMRLSADGSLISTTPFNTTARSTQAVVQPLADAQARIGAAPSQRPIYFTDIDNDQVVKFDPVTNSQVATVPVGGEPRGIAASPDGDRLYVANRASSRISVIDTATFTTLDPIALPAGAEPYGMAITPDGRKLYVAAEAGNGAVYSVDLSGERAPLMISSGRGAREVAVSPDGSLVYVTNMMAGTVAVIDAFTDSVVTALSVNAASGIAFSPDGNHVYVAGGGSVGRVHQFEVGGDPNPVQEWMVGSSPENVVITPDGRLLIVANRASEYLSVIDVSNQNPPKQIPLRMGFGAVAALQPAPQ